MGQEISMSDEHFFSPEWDDPDRPLMECEKGGHDDGSYVIYDGQRMTAGLAAEMRRMDKNIEARRAKLRKTWQKISEKLADGGEWIETSLGVWVKK